MIAVKHTDPVLGVDIHIVMIPTPGGPVPTPIPHPFIGMVFEAIDWIPLTIMIPKAVAEAMAGAMEAVETGIEATGVDMGGQGMFPNEGEGGAAGGGGRKGAIAQGGSSAGGGGKGGGGPVAAEPPAGPEGNLTLGPSGPGFVAIPLNASVWVNGIPRGHATTMGFGSPHIPIGGPMFQRPPVMSQKSECELLLGSMTVIVDGSPFSYLGLTSLSCSCIGAPPPPDPDGKAGAGMFMPASVVLAIPAGRLVLVGGPPVPNYMAMAFKSLGALKKLQKGSKAMKKLSEKLNAIAAKVIKSDLGRAIARKAICLLTGHPVDVATGKVLTDIVDFELPGPIPLEWERTWFSTSNNNTAIGHGWHHSYDMAMAFDEKEKVVALRMGDGRCIGSPFLEVGEKYFNQQERLGFFREENGYGVFNANVRLTYRFSKTKTGGFHPLTSIENQTGHAITFEYTRDGHLKKITDSAKRELQVNTDHKGRILSILAPHPKHIGETFPIVSYEYDKHGDLVASKDAMGHGYHYRYENHLLMQETSPNGLSFYFEYNGKDQNAWCIRTWGDGGIYDHKLTYHIEEKYTVVENSLGHKSTHFWNDQGLVFRSVDPLGNVSSKRYGKDTNIMSETDELGRITIHTYDGFSNRTSTNFPDGSTIQMKYDGSLLTAAVDQNGGTWKWGYDGSGQLTERTNPLGLKTKYGYENGLLKAIIDPMGSATALQYNDQYNLISLTTPDGAASRWEYDALGRCTAATDPKGNKQRRKFNLNGWVRQVNEPDGNVRELEFDAEGNVTRAKDNQHDVRFEYAGMGRLKARTEANTRVEFKYNTEEDLLGIINEHGYAYRFELDANSEVVTESGFDGVTRRYVRDGAGRVVEVKRASGMVTKYGYDAVDQVIKVEHSDGSLEEFAYRPDGELLEAKNKHITVKFERDQLGQVLKEMQGGFVLESKYDVLGMRSKLTSSLGANLTFGRNNMGDVEKVSANADENPWEASFKRDNLGLELERSLPGGVRSTWKRDRLGRPIEQKTMTAGGKLTRSREYKWDVNDRLKQITDPQQGTWNFQHDDLGNLASAQYPDGSFEFRVPDSVGNLFKTKDQKDRKYGPAGQLLEANGTHYEYDPEGNLIKKTGRNGATWHYEWNAAGMLRRVIRPDGDIVAFNYDALGRRISKSYRGKTTRWVWDGNVPLHEWVEVERQTVDGERQTVTQEGSEGRIKIRRREIQLASAPANAPPAVLSTGEPSTVLHPPSTEITTWLFEPESFAPLAKLRDGQQFSIVTDHLGTPVGMYNQGGEKVWEMDLSIYGEVRNLDGWREACPFRYPGQYEDVETGLYYNRFRYYDAEGGFYVSQDPIGLRGGRAIYAYVIDSNSWVDPLGLLCKKLRKRLSQIEALAETPGNSGLRGALSRRELMRLGREFVGPNYRIMRGRSGEMWMVSADGKRLFRSPTQKSSSFARTGSQANFHQRRNTNADFFDQGSSSNVHVHMN